MQWLQDHVDLKQERGEYAQTILDQIKGSRIYVDESQRAEAAHRFGSYNDFRKSMLGRITLVNEGETSLDSWWQEMVTHFNAGRHFFKQPKFQLTAFLQWPIYLPA